MDVSSHFVILLVHLQPCHSSQGARKDSPQESAFDGSRVVRTGIKVLSDLFGYHSFKRKHLLIRA
jgi:hypothetical protein